MFHVSYWELWFKIYLVHSCSTFHLFPVNNRSHELSGALSVWTKFWETQRKEMSPYLIAERSRPWVSWNAKRPCQNLEHWNIHDLTPLNNSLIIEGLLSWLEIGSQRKLLRDSYNTSRIVFLKQINILRCFTFSKSSVVSIVRSAFSWEYLLRIGTVDAK
jgi:hypothetical protein